MQLKSSTLELVPFQVLQFKPKNWGNPTRSLIKLSENLGLSDSESVYLDSNFIVDGQKVSQS